MKKVCTLIFLCGLMFTVIAQDSSRTTYVRKPALGISFFFNDYTTPQRIRSSSLSSVLVNDQTAKFKEMDPGFALSYFRGLTEHVDFAGTLASSFVTYDVSGKNTGSKERFLLEADASANLKLFSEKYIFTPYAALGVGFSKYGVYYGAFVPVGLGLKFNLFDEAHIFVNSSYRIPVISNTAAYHLMHGIGIAGIIGGAK
jgi:hypothetical protein